MKHGKEFEFEMMNRESVFYIGIAIFIVLLISSIVLIIIGSKGNKKTFIQYSDNKNIEYNVGLKQNDYYKELNLGKGNQYISNLINTINADFEYHFNLPTQYNYNYKIVGVANVIDEKTNKTIYTFSENLVTEQIGQSDGTLDIKQNIDVDFNKYNNLMKEFVKSYDLKNVTCTLSLNLNLGIDSTTQLFETQNMNVMSLEVPLAQNTIAIDTKYLVSNDNLIELSKENFNATPLFIASAILLGIDILFGIAFIIYWKKTETEEDKYNRQLKKILNNYDSYISRVDDEFDMQEYQILKVQRFLDLLEIRDTMQLPIIMLENKEQSKTCFVIPTQDKILYFYSIGLTQHALPTGESMEESIEEMEIKYEQEV